MDYRLFRAEHGLTARDMIAAVSEQCPRYTKIQQSMVDQPEKYGVRLLQSLDEKLVELCSAQTPREIKKASPQRTKPHRLVVYLPDDLNRKFAEIRAREGCTTQELLKDLIENWLIATRDI